MSSRAIFFLIISMPSLARAASSPTPPFRMIDFDKYETVYQPVRGKNGRALIESFCFKPPAGCPKDSLACSFYPEYPDSLSYYDFKLRAQKGANETLYSVDAAAFVSAPLAPTKRGRVVMWRGFGARTRERQLVWEQLVKESGEEEARTRLDYLDRMIHENRWHELQHVRHAGQFFEAYQRILNTPRGLPRELKLPATADPYPVLEKAATKDRDARVDALVKDNDACSAGFHRRQDRDDSYQNILEECACYGGESCRRTLPPFPPEDFKCDFSP